MKTYTTYEPQFSYQPPAVAPDEIRQGQVVFSNEPAPVVAEYTQVTAGSDYVDLSTGILFYRGMTITVNPDQLKKFKKLAASICIASLQASMEGPDAE